MENLNKMEVIMDDLKETDAVRHAAKDEDIISHLSSLIAIPYSYIPPRETISVFQERYLRYPKLRNEYYAELFSYPIYRNEVILLQSYDSLFETYQKFELAVLRYIVEYGGRLCT